MKLIFLLTPILAATKINENQVNPQTAPTGTPVTEEEKALEFLASKLTIAAETNKPYLTTPAYEPFENNKSAIQSALQALFKESWLTLEHKARILNHFLLKYRTARDLTIADGKKARKYQGLSSFYDILKAHKVYEEVQKTTEELGLSFELFNFILGRGKKSGAFSEVESLPFALACVCCENTLDEMAEAMPEYKEGIDMHKAGLSKLFRAVSNRLLDSTKSMSATAGNESLSLEAILTNHLSTAMVSNLNGDIESLETLFLNFLNYVNSLKPNDQVREKVRALCNYLMLSKSLVELVSHLTRYQEGACEGLGSYTHATALKISDISLNLFAMILGDNKNAYANLDSCFSEENFTWWKEKKVLDAFGQNIEYISEVNQFNISSHFTEALNYLSQEATRLEQKNIEEMEVGELEEMDPEAKALLNMSKVLSERFKALMPSEFDTFNSSVEEQVNSKVQALATKISGAKTAKLSEETVPPPGNTDQDPIVVADPTKTTPYTEENGDIGV